MQYHLHDPTRQHEVVLYCRLLTLTMQRHAEAVSAVAVSGCFRRQSVHRSIARGGGLVRDCMSGMESAWMEPEIVQQDCDDLLTQTALDEIRQLKNPPLAVRRTLEAGCSRISFIPSNGVVPEKVMHIVLNAQRHSKGLPVQGIKWESVLRTWFASTTVVSAAMTACFVGRWLRMIWRSSWRRTTSINCDGDVPCSMANHSKLVVRSNLSSAC